MAKARSPKKRAKATGRHRAKPEPLSEALGAHIRELREDKGISFDAVVGTSELGRGYVSEVERGLAVPSVLTLARLAAALEVSLVDLLNEVSPDRPSRTELIRISSALSDSALSRLVETARGLLEEQQADDE